MPRRKKHGGRRANQTGRPPTIEGGRRASVYLSARAVKSLESTGKSVYKAASEVIEQWALMNNPSK